MILGELLVDGLISVNVCMLLLDKVGLVVKDVRLNFVVAAGGGGG